MKKTRVPFGDRLSGLCAMELTQARGDPEAAGEMIERLTNSLAFTIAICAKGDPDAMNTMIEGVNSYLLESATGHQQAGQFLR